MKINPNFKIRRIAGESIVVNQGTATVNMTRIISLNESACLLYQEMAGKDFTIEDAVKVLTDNYNVSDEIALKDVETWVESLKQCGIID